MQGFLGSGVGIAALYILFLWVKNHFVGPEFLQVFTLNFFSLQTIAIIIAASILLCTLGSYTTVEKFLKQ